MSAETTARPYQVGDRVRLAAHLVPHFDGQTHGIVEEVVGTRYQDVLVNVAGTVYWFASTDLTLDPTNPSGGAVTSTPAPSDDTITLTLDGATMARHTTDPDLADLYAAGWTRVVDPREALIEAALAWDDVVRTGNETAITVAAELLRGAVADFQAEVAR